MSKKARVAPRAAEATAEVGDLNEAGELPLYFPALAVEGMSTSDGRTIKPGALGHRALPFSILAQYTNPGQQGGHAGAEIIGHMTEMWRKPGPEVVSRETGQPFPDGTFVWQGRGVADPDTRGGDLARKGHLLGNSVDLSELDFTEEFDDQDRQRVTITAGKIAATTLCPIPAFADAYVQIGDDTDLTADQDDLTALDAEAFERRFNAAPEDEPERLGEYLGELLRRKGVEAVTAALGTWGTLDSVLVAHGAGPDAVADLTAGYVDLLTHPLPPFRSAELGDDCGPCLAEIEGEEWTETTRADGMVEFAPTVAKRKRAFARGLAIKGDKADGSDASYPIENQADLDKAAHMVGLGNDPDGKIKLHIRKAAKKLNLTLPQSLQADGGYRLPPLALFADPRLPAPTPITIGTPREDGRREISGHIATWNECHVSYTGRCVRPPHSRTDYARFATGAARALDGDQVRTVAVGRISMSRTPAEGGHAPATLSEADTVAFYDNHCLAVADVAAGEDSHGIWIHGLTRELTEQEVDQLLSSPPSGDWRNHHGNLELCAVLAVNNPGYVVPRSRVASGEPVSLVAAGMLRPSAEFAGPVTLQAIQTAVRTEIMNALVAFFDPDNDGDIDRPLDTDSGMDTSATHGGTDDDTTGTQTASLDDRRAAAMRSIRSQAALAEVGAPFVPRR